jgi:hypothetical protein
LTRLIQIGYARLRLNLPRNPAHYTINDNFLVIGLRCESFRIHFLMRRVYLRMSWSHSKINWRSISLVCIAFLHFLVGRRTIIVRSFSCLQLSKNPRYLLAFLYLAPYHANPIVQEFLKCLSSECAPVISLLPIACHSTIEKLLPPDENEEYLPPLRLVDVRVLLDETPVFAKVYMAVISNCEYRWPVRDNFFYLSDEATLKLTI